MHACVCLPYFLRGNQKLLVVYIVMNEFYYFIHGLSVWTGSRLESPSFKAMVSADVTHIVTNADSAILM